TEADAETAAERVAEAAPVLIDQADAEDGAEPPDVVAPAPAARAFILVTSRPAGARVVVAGNPIGVTPVEVPRPPEGMRWKVVFSKANYRPVTRYLSEADDALDVTLAPRPKGGDGPKPPTDRDGGGTGPAPPPFVP
ncbi:MAG: PEGA domain-containing protein, partial [Deltaproteobacteria bacterium]